MASHALLYKCPHCGTSQEIEPTRDDQVVVCSNLDCRKPFEAELPVAHPQNGGNPPGIIVPEGAASPPEPPAPPLPAADLDHGPAVTKAGEEKVVAQLRPAVLRRFPFRSMTWVLMFILGTVVAATGWQNGFNVLVVIGAVFLGIGAYHLVKGLLWARVTTMTVTTHRTTLVHGLFNKEKVEVDHNDIDYLRVHRSAVNRIMRTGDLAIYTKGVKKQLLMIGVPDPEATANLIRAQVTGAAASADQSGGVPAANAVSQSG